MVEIYQALALNWQKQAPRVGCSNASCDSRIDFLRSDTAGSLTSIKLYRIGVNVCLNFAEVCLSVVDSLN